MDGRSLATGGVPKKKVARETAKMGQRGPRPKATALRELEGNPGRLPVNAAEPRPTGAPKAPDYLSDAAKRVWREIAASMPPGLYAKCDAALLAAFCEAAAAHRAAALALTASRSQNLLGETEVVADGKVSPYLRAMLDAARTMSTLSGRLGLSPADRVGLRMDTPNDGDERWAGLLS